LQNIVGFVDVRVLINDRVTGVVPDELDGHVELLFTLHAIAGGGHLRTSGNGIVPGKTGDLRLHRVFRHRDALNSDGVGRFARAAVATIDADVTGEDRQHSDGTSGLFAVGLALGTPALADIRRFRGADFPRQFDNALGGNAGNSGRPVWRFGDAIIAVTQNIG